MERITPPWSSLNIPSTNLPKISIVTPSYNQAKYLEQTILSIISQNYPNLEYIIIDGGSCDGTIDIIKKYEKYITYWESTPDRGHYHAINKGFSKATGEIMAWLNSDDMYFPWTLWVVAEVFSKFPNVEWVTSSYPVVLNENGIPIKCRIVDGYTSKSFFKGKNMPGKWFHTGYIQQESTFWRRTLWEKAGGYVNDNLKYAGDFELWCRFFKHATLYCVRTFLGGFRKHKQQSTYQYMNDYIREATETLLKYGEPYNRLETRLKSAVFRNHTLRDKLDKLWIKTGILERAREIVYNPEKQDWEIVEKFIV